MLPLSSVARTRRSTAPLPLSTPVHDQFVLWAARVRSAGCQLLPPSVEISTPATTPPTSDAVPETVVLAPFAIAAPVEGDVIAEDGAVVSVDALAATSPAVRVAGCAPMSANRFTVACCIRGSGGRFTALPSSRPHVHSIVP